MELSKKARDFYPSTVTVTQELHRIVGLFLNRAYNYEIINYRINVKMLFVWLSKQTIESLRKRYNLFTISAVQCPLRPESRFNFGFGYSVVFYIS
jgi:hypothetical protein